MRKIIVLFLLVLACGPLPSNADSGDGGVSEANEIMIVNLNIDHGAQDTLNCDLDSEGPATIGGGGSASFRMTPDTVTCTWPDGRIFQIVMYVNPHQQP